MFFVIALIVGLVIGAVANLIIQKNVTVTIETPLAPSPFTWFEPTFTAYRDGDVCMMQFWTLDAAKAWASESFHFEIYSTVGNLITSR